MTDSKNSWLQQRYMIAFMGFFTLANGYIQRFCISLAITEMVATHKHAKIDPYACPMPPTSNLTVVKGAEFNWDEATQGLILSAVFWGYVVMQIPAGLFSEKFGPKITLGIGMMTSTVMTLLTPIVSRMGGAEALIILRVVLGFGQGALYPSLSVLLANWSPLEERGRLGAVIFAGAQIGNVLSMALTGLIIEAGGWAAVFYSFGVLGLIWAVLWQFLVYNTPSDSPHISSKEKKFLLENAGRQSRTEKLETPWRGILTSVPLWGLIIAQVGHDWGLFTIITDLPKYMKSVMHFTITENGFLSASPYLAMWLFAIFSGMVVDWLVSTKKMNVTPVRKIFVTIASVGPALGIIAASYSGCDKLKVSIFFTTGMGLMGAFVPSLKVNALDLSPNFSGTCMGLVGGIGAVSGIISPYLVGLLIPNSTLLEWRLVFWIAVFVLCSTNLVFIIFGSGEVQPWNEPRTKTKDSKFEMDEKTSNRL